MWKNKMANLCLSTRNACHDLPLPMARAGLFKTFSLWRSNAAVNVNSVPPLVRHSTPIRHLIEGQNSTPFHQGLNIISPGHAGTNFFSSGLKARSSPFFPVVKERTGIRHQCWWLQINIIHVELVFLETDRTVSSHWPLHKWPTKFMYLVLKNSSLVFKSGECCP
jgi:hypothetical protein